MQAGGISFGVATAAAKLVSAYAGPRVLEQDDPVFGLRVQTILVSASAFELGVALVCLGAGLRVSLLAITWLSTVFLSYRLGLWWIGWQKPCSCLGNLADALNISPQLADNIMKGLLAFMFIGSVSLLIMHYRQNRAAGSPSSPVPEPDQALS